MTDVTTLNTPPVSDDGLQRELKPAIRKGWRKLCPSCGTGKMFKGYLKVQDTCTVCGEDLYHHRADDGPAYLTILVVGHLMAPLLHITYVNFVQEPMMLASIFTVGTVATSLYLLPRFKGFMVGFQWAKRMHGFKLDGDV
ncbi:DUF983 domain-containing protein [Aliiroseovarius sediminis]|uniref:DUF983 domain-containing protein n=1 Tax=Aliiroseovarius sediminis TaxID=2925839 RepID=UPI001F58882D|nr:DUF983 domain-containing protein [Aliiroseovarius sediminis]MCI2393048.1 DUF983 domain-containing protein [Aliiroseovarius sediminis]